MRITLVLLLLALFAKSGTMQVEKYCHDNFPGYRVRYVLEDEGRVKDGVIYVECVVSHSLGRDGGTTTNGHYIGYNEIVPKGKRVVSYVVWNPEIYDDVVAVYDNGKLR